MLIVSNEAGIQKIEAKGNITLHQIHDDRFHMATIQKTKHNRNVNQVS